MKPAIALLLYTERFWNEQLANGKKLPTIESCNHLSNSYMWLVVAFLVGFCTTMALVSLSLGIQADWTQLILYNWHRFTVC